MENLFYTALEKINNSFNPIETAWNMSCQYLQIDHLLSKNFNKELFNNQKEFNNSNPYHDQYHLAEVIYLSAYLLKHEFDNQEDINRNAFPLLFSAMFHDFKHLGRSNKLPFELEFHSVKNTREYFEDNNLDKLWNEQDVVRNDFVPKFERLLDIISNSILDTEFKEKPEAVRLAYQVKEEESRIKTYAISQILIESDILLSVLHRTGFEKTEQILKEANVISSPKEILDKWSKFLNNIKDKHFISKASEELKINDQLDFTLKTIKEINQLPFRNNEQVKEVLNKIKPELLSSILKVKMR